MIEGCYEERAKDCEQVGHLLTVWAAERLKVSTDKLLCLHCGRTFPIEETAAAPLAA